MTAVASIADLPESSRIGATAKATPKTMSEAAFEKWAIRQPHVRVEWVDGEVRPMSPINWEHTDLEDWLGRLLGMYVEQKDLGKVVGPDFMVRLHPDNPRRRMPDLLYIAKARLNLVRRNYLDGPPDLAVEIVSPDDPSRDYREKFIEYESAGVREYWIVDPALARLEVYGRNRSGTFALVPLVDHRIQSKALRGLSIDPRWLFAAKRPTVLAVLKQLGVV